MYLTKQNLLTQVKYANLLESEERLEERFLGFGAELYFKPREIGQYNTGITKRILEFVKKNHLPLQLHAPIAPLDCDLYEKVTHLSKELDIRTVVAHAEASEDVFLWKEISNLLARNSISLNLENHNESNPDPIISLYKNIGLKTVGLCVDPGHVNAFGKIGILEWIGKYPGGSLKEVHLADNLGDDDTHLPLGEGNIDIKALFETLEKRSENITFVLEPKSLAGARHSLEFLRNNKLLA